MKIALVGDACADFYVHGTCRRLCPEGPVPVLERSKDERRYVRAGMAGNVAANLTSMGAEVKTWVTPSSQREKKTRYIDDTSGQLLLRVDDTPESVEGMNPSHRFALEEMMRDYDALVISDYDKGFLSSYDIATLGSRANRVGVPCFLDTKKPSLRYLTSDNFTAVKLNEEETLRGGHTGLNNLVTTLGPRGCVYRGKTYPLEEAVEVRSVSGAGDTFLAALVVGYLREGNIEKALPYANKCASEVVKHPGTTVYEEKT